MGNSNDVHRGPGSERPIEFVDVEPPGKAWVYRPWPRADEKVTVNLAPVHIGMIDLLAAHGLHRGRSAAIRHAIARELGWFDTYIRRVIEREKLTVGCVRFGRSELERLRDEHESVVPRVLGCLCFDEGVDAELVEATIRRAVVYGSIRGPRTLLDRIRPDRRPLPGIG